MIKEKQSNIVYGKVVDIHETEKYNKITVKKGLNKTIIYDYDFVNLKIGYIIEAKGIILNIEENRVENGFNYKEYLLHQKVVNSIKSNTLSIRKYSFDIGRIKSYFSSYIDNYFDDDSRIILKAFIIGDDNFNEEFSESIINNGILHLFAISGLHIILFISLITKLLNMFNIKDHISEVIICFLLFIYMILTNFAPSVLRATLMYYLSTLNKFIKLGLSSLDILSIIFIILIILNPYYIYNLGFSLSFLAATIIIVVSPIIKNKNNYINIFLLSLYVIIISLPITININNKINILSPITNVLFIVLVEKIILPFSFIVLILPILNVIYKYLILTFTKLTLLFSKYFVINISFPDFSVYTIILYYLFIFLIIKYYNNRNVKNIISTLLILFLLVISNINKFVPYGEIEFLDLYNGEAIIIRDSFNKCNAVIDTGDGTRNEVSSYLKNKGIKKLDYLILTHNHVDHNGETNNIINQIDVNKIMVSAYYNSVLDHNMSIIKVKENDVIKCGQISFNILHPDKEYINENDNSIVIHSKIGNSKFLFLGDITKNIEERLIKYNLNVDVVKIAHHGSNTSTSNNFISKIKPKYAIIQTGRIEKFGFPNEKTINTLVEYNVQIYRTDLNYSIKYRYTKKQSIFKTLK